MTNKIEIYNNITNTKRYADYSNFNLENNESILSIFPIEKTTTYYEKRIEVIKDLADIYISNVGKDKTAGGVKKMELLKNSHFKTDVKLDDAELNSVLSARPVGDECRYVPELVDYIRRVIDSMSLSDFSMFIDVLHNFEPIVYMVTQPAFILALGYKVYSLALNKLQKIGGLMSYVKEAVYSTNVHKNRNLMAGLYWSINKRIGGGILTNTAISVGLLTGSFFVYTIGSMFIGGTPGKEVDNKIMTPLRVGGEISSNVDLAARLAESWAGEATRLLRAIPKGFWKTLISEVEDTVRSMPKNNPK